jgi:hypothetical protein
VFTRAEPPKIEPPIAARSSFAERSSEYTSMRQRRLASLELGAGIPFRLRMSSTAIASFSVEAPGKRARAFQAAPAPVRRSWTKKPQTPGKRRARARVAEARAVSSEPRSTGIGPE